MSDIFYDVLAEVISNMFPTWADGVGPINKLFDFNNLLKQRILVNPNRGIPTDINAIDKYIEEVISSIMENESSFIDNLLEPVRRNPLDML